MKINKKNKISTNERESLIKVQNAINIGHRWDNSFFYLPIILINLIVQIKCKVFISRVEEHLLIVQYLFLQKSETETNKKRGKNSLRPIWYFYSVKKIKADNAQFVIICSKGVKQRCWHLLSHLRKNWFSKCKLFLIKAEMHADRWWNPKKSIRFLLRLNTFSTLKFNQTSASTH